MFVNRTWKLCLVIILIGSQELSYSRNYALAQLQPDKTLEAESSIVKPNVTVNGLSSEQIEGGAVRGANLFHSFQEFNIGEGRGVYFFSPDRNIQNIVTRVTGNSASQILGTLGTVGSSTPNLFLINPNGIIFGSNASLDVKGSFVGTTANAIQFGKQGFFEASAPNALPLLTVNPSAFLFNQITTASIVNNSRKLVGERLDPFSSETSSRSLFGLRVPNGQSLLLVGGNLSLEGGGLNALNGRVELGGLAEAGTVGLNINGSSFSLGFPPELQRADISLTQGATIDATGESGGNIHLQARRITLASGSQIVANTLGETSGGSLIIDASDSVTLNDFTSGGLLTTQTTGAGNAGSIRINAGKLIARDGAQISTVSYSQGSGGQITLAVWDSIELTGISPDGQYNTGLFSSAAAAGNAGDIQIDTGSLIVKNRAVISAESAGTIVQDEFVPATGRGGNITINTKQLMLQNGGRVSAESSGKGQGGDLWVNASEFVNLSGFDVSRGRSSRLSTRTNGEGQGGNITVNTPDFRVADGAIVDALTTAQGNGGDVTLTVNSFEAVNGGQVLTTTRGSGNAGDINLNATNSITLTGSDPDFARRLARFGRTRVDNEGAASGLFANTAQGSTGNGGNIKLQTRQLNVEQGAEVTVRSAGLGNAGNLEVTANSVRVENDGKLSATSELSSDGGNIILQNLDLLTLRNNGEISTNAKGAGDGGNINIDTDNLILAERSKITAQAVDGRGGNISITTQGLFVSPDSTIDASSDRGINGIVEIRRPDVDPSQELVILPADVIDVSGLVAQGCSVNGVASGESSFAITGRGGLPPTPAEATRSESVLTDLGSTEKSQVISQKSKAIPTPLETSNKVNPAPLVEATGWVVGSNGEVVLTASVTNDTLNIPWFRPHSCNGT